MEKKAAIKVASELFPSYPGTNELHVTSDGQAFFNEHDAKSHADFLGKEKDEVIAVKRSECEKPAKDDGAGKGAGKDAKE